MRRKRRRESDWVDDGRTIVNMNVEGMPGYRAPVSTGAHKQETPRPQERLSPREERMVLLAGMKWAFLFSLGIVAVLVLFVLFCTRVWLR
ncbi:MAG: hypothetical protein VB062_00670 [Christensenella sp.]|nr:hypothetical protein [Christensenella sp.]